MRIALIIEHFDPTRGGAEHFTVWLAGALAKRGHEVHIVCHDVAARVNRYRQATQRASHDADRSHQAHPPEEIPLDGVHIHRLRGMRLNSGFGFRLFGRRAAAWVKKHHPDVSHSMTVAFPGDLYHPHAGIYAQIQQQAIASRATSAQARWKKLMLHFSGKQRALLTLEKEALGIRGRGGAKRIVSLCQMMTDELHRHYQLDPKKVVLLPNPRLSAEITFDGPDEEDRRNWFHGHYRLGAHDRVAVFVGHDFRRKGLRYAIEAIARTRDWKLLVVGLGKAKEYVELANNLGIGDVAPKGGQPRVLFVGPTREMDRVYAAADALILPTFYDSFGLVVIEAFSHGLPVISTESLGASYLVRAHNAGTIVATPREIDAMASALESLPPRGSPAQRALAERARKASLALSPEKYLDRLEKLYQELARP